MLLCREWVPLSGGWLLSSSAATCITTACVLLQTFSRCYLLLHAAPCTGSS
jgi:hypothetical protein